MRAPLTWTAAVLVTAAAGLVLTGCSATGTAGTAATIEAAPSSSSSPSSSPAGAAPTGTWSAPPAGAGFDYQLSGPYAPPPGVSVVARDRTAAPAGLGYDICYVNGFQTQPDASEAFAAAHPELLVQTGDGPLVDPGWPDELLYDTSTAAEREALAALVGPWIQGCAADGFDAVELDNLDSYTRSQGHLDAADDVAMAMLYADVAHGAGLAVAQKNTAEESARLRAAGYDFAVTESCVRYEECGAYAAQYPMVLDVEYVDELGEEGFERACAAPGRPTVMVLRDHDLLTPDDPGYVYRSCDG